MALRGRARRAGGVAQPRLAMRGVDFATDELRDALRDLEDTGLDRDAPTVAVAEGLLMYLRPAAVAALWQDVRAHCRARVDVVASAINRKNVVEGKRVAGRVDFGGCGFIKKKK